MSYGGIHVLLRNSEGDVSGPGSVSTQLFAQGLRQALADETVSQILIDIDSPGGSVYGVAELADEIARARAQKSAIQDIMYWEDAEPAPQPGCEKNVTCTFLSIGTN